MKKRKQGTRGRDLGKEGWKKKERKKSFLTGVRRGVTQTVEKA